MCSKCESALLYLKRLEGQKTTVLKLPVYRIVHDVLIRKSTLCPSSEVMWSRSTEGSQGSEDACVTLCVTHARRRTFSKLVECTTPRVNPKVSPGPWVLMCQCGLVAVTCVPPWWGC